MKIQNLLTGIAICGLSFTGNAQSFQRSLLHPGADMNHYSIENTPGGNYVCAGTLFTGSGNDIHVIKFDPSGNILWERLVDESADDRALDVVVDPNDDIVVSGYISPAGLTYPELYVIKFDASGSPIGDRSIQQFHASAGTNIIYSQANNSYIVGGFYSEPLSFPLIGNEALIMEFDLNLNYVGHMQYSSTLKKHTSVNDIVEVPGGFFITGSLGMSAGYPTGQQGVLALKLDANLNMTDNLSFESTNSEHVGVSAVYDNASDEIYLLSNNSVIHNPQVSTIVDVSGGPFISNHYYLELDPSYGSHNAAGFQLKPSLWDPTTLIAAGYFRTNIDGTGANVNAIPWIVEFKKSNGGQVAGYFWPAPSPNFQSHGGGILSTFSGEHPYIFNQEILTERLDGNGYVIVGPRKLYGQFGIDLVTTWKMNSAPCLEPQPYNELNIAGNPISVGDNFTAVADPVVNASVANTATKSTIFCKAIFTKKASKPTIVMDDFKEVSAFSNANNNVKFNVAPNPFTSQFTVELSGEELEGKLIVQNSLGQTVYTSELISGTYYRGQINLNEFENGIYLLKFNNGQNELIKKIVKL